MIDLDEQGQREGVCDECGAASAHFRSCADCDYSVGRCADHGDRKGVSRMMHLHRREQHGSQLLIFGTATSVDPVLELAKPNTRADCEPCKVCQAYADADIVPDVLPCGHTRDQSANHCRPCPWVSCRHHNLLEVAKAKPKEIRIRMCSFEGCNGRSKARSVCSTHYEHWKAGKFDDAKLAEVASRPPRFRIVTRDARPTTLRLNRAPELGVMGRRPGLRADDSTETAQEWIDDAVSHLDLMRETCSIDVADANPDGYPLVSVANLLGVTTAAIKEEVEPAADKLRDGLKEYRDHAPGDHAGLLARAQER